MSINLFGNDGYQSLPLAGADVRYYADFFTAQEADAYLQTLIETMPWRQDPIWMFGKQVLQPRLVCWVGDPEAVIRYSGIAMQPQAWTESLLAMKAAIERKCEMTFNGVLVNYYRDGQDSMGWHADDEAELGPQPVIPSVSLGASRKFQFRAKAGGPITNISLTHGSLLVMQGDTQANYKHQLPKMPAVQQARLNLTFRKIVK